jgi:putative ABC transport system permease protein
VAAVVVMVAIGAGTHARIQQEIQKLGATTLRIHPGSARTGGVHAGIGTRPTLTDGDARAIAAEVQDVIAAAPLLRGRAQLAARSANWSTVLNGTTEAFFVARDWPLASGRGFLPEETDMARKVAILGSTAAVELFGDEDPVDHTIRINHLAFQVIGVLSTKGQTMDWLGPR